MWSNVDASNTDYAIGIDDGSMWPSVLASVQGFNWYAGTVRIARLTGLGFLMLKNKHRRKPLYRWKY